MKTLIALLALLLVGCAPVDNTDYSFDAETPMGIKVRHEGMAHTINPNNIDEYYRTFSQCAMRSTPAPFFLLVFQDSPVNDDGQEVDGLILFAQKMPVIYIYSVDGAEDWTLSVFGHEVIHALLWYQMRPTGHDQPEFNDCDYL